jgi:hypothetical protein
MAAPYWKPSTKYTKQELVLLKRLRRTRKLFAFLRDRRDEIFDPEFQDELVSMYRDSGQGKQPLPPAMLAMAILLQSYSGVSDAEAVELTVVDLRWQMVLDQLGSKDPAFSQGALYDFRERLIRHDMDRRLLERTVEVARRSKAFDWKKLPKDLRIAMDSSPLEGSGKVEDTVNLLAHAARKVVQCVATLLKWPVERVAREAGIPLLSASSVKKGLDIDWSNPKEKAHAVARLTKQIEALDVWLHEKLPEEVEKPPLSELLETLKQILEQDTEPDPSGGGGRKIKEGVATDRRISIEDAEMRHGRKSKTKRFNGYKRHVATDLDTDLIMACAVTPANQPEEQAAAMLDGDIKHQKHRLGELHVDRGYIKSPIIADVLDDHGDVYCKPWRGGDRKVFGKSDFKFNMRDMTITCPAGEVKKIKLGQTVKFAPKSCDACELRPECTRAKPGVGRSVEIANDEKLQHKLRKMSASRAGRQKMRERVGVEHHLSHLGRRQGPRARYAGTRKNLFDVRRACTVQNLETIQRNLEVQSLYPLPMGC